MFTWQSSPFVAPEEDESGFRGPELDLSVTVSGDDALLWSEAFLGDADATPAANSDDFSRHDVLSAAQEVALARELQTAFAGLQAALVAMPEQVEQLIQHVVEERWSGSEKLSNSDAVRCDSIVTLHDHWRVLVHLSGRDAGMSARADAVYLELLHSLQCFPLTRDWLLALAESSLKQQTGSSRQGHPLATRLHHLYRLRDEFITRNIRLVYFIARRHLDKGMDLEDMVQEGVLGLFRATLKYDADAGTRFSTYAYWWILQAIRQAISRQRSLIRFPNNVNLQVNRLHAFRQRFWFQHGRWPDQVEIQRNTGLSAASVRDLLGLSNLCVSADSPLREDDERCLLDELTESEALPPPDVECERSERALLIERYLAVLAPREATVLRLKYGIGHDRSYTLHEIAPVIGVSGERVRQLEKIALEKIRQYAGEASCL